MSGALDPLPGASYEREPLKGSEIGWRRAPAHLSVEHERSQMGPLDCERYIDWNFVSSSRARLQQARLDWKGGRFPKVPGDEVEFIPLPE